MQCLVIDVIKKLNVALPNLLICPTVAPSEHVTNIGNPPIPLWLIQA